jgi:hypothetical protein
MMFTILSTCRGGGYMYCRTEPPHPKRNAKGLYPLHRVLMENKIGRLLDSGEVVHHRDENKSNDSIDNLELLTNSDHSRHHAPKVDPIECVCHCGKRFTVKPNDYRKRMRQSQTGHVSCSRPCAGHYKFLVRSRIA